MTSTKTLMLSAAAAAFIATAGTALALVDFDPISGTGFVGKGDVQNVFGWNNATLQRNALTVGFKYEAVTEYDAVCLWITGPVHNRKTHRATHTEISGLNSELNGQPRPGPSQFTGFNLLGWLGEPTIIGDVPVEGESCQGEGIDGTWESVTEVSSSGSLYATFGGNDKLIYALPPAP